MNPKEKMQESAGNHPLGMQVWQRLSHTLLQWHWSSPIIFHHLPSSPHLLFYQAVQRWLVESRLWVYFEDFDLSSSTNRVMDSRIVITLVTTMQILAFLFFWSDSTKALGLPHTLRNLRLAHKTLKSECSRILAWLLVESFNGIVVNEKKIVVKLQMFTVFTAFTPISIQHPGEPPGEYCCPRSKPWNLTQEGSLSDACEWIADLFFFKPNWQVCFRTKMLKGNKISEF